MPFLLFELRPVLADLVSQVVLPNLRDVVGLLSVELLLNLLKLGESRIRCELSLALLLKLFLQCAFLLHFSLALLLFAQPLLFIRYPLLSAAVGI